jgi:hypothetical protein
MFPCMGKCSCTVEYVAVYVLKPTVSQTESNQTLVISLWNVQQTELSIY